MHARGHTPEIQVSFTSKTCKLAITKLKESREIGDYFWMSLPQTDSSLTSSAMKAEVSERGFQEEIKSRKKNILGKDGDLE